uniref:Protein PET100 homolog, mitochondrial n=1 Tax=Ornithodoros turicata TaxID=34597 RepID=A0A2R5LF88_9ACAR
MGGWKLEVFKMTIYMAFPVGLFYFFNQPKYFEKWVVKTKRECFPPQDNENDRAIRQFIKERQAKQREELERELKAH